MSNMRITINKIKGITRGTIELPIDNGIYCIVGNNGAGKSTIMSCMAQLISRHNLGLLGKQDYNQDSYVEFAYKFRTDRWFCEKGFWKADSFPHTLSFNGTYEGSLFYGMRFRDSKSVDQIMDEGKINDVDLADADEYIQNTLGQILHNDASYYSGLKRIKNKQVAEKFGLKNTPYFRAVEDSLISQYRMSSGECLLISLLHFIYNSLIRRSLPSNQPIIMLMDEIELALHPMAITNLLSILKELTEHYDNLTVILTSHSPEVIRNVNPKNIFKIEKVSNSDNNLNIINPCYPSYAIRDVYTHDGFDYLLLVEDELARIVVKNAIEELKLQNSRLINVLPVGGWSNVLKLQYELITNNVLGAGKQVFSILDGDVKDKINKEYRPAKKMFLPISSVEKYLRETLVVAPAFITKKRINDSFFQIKSIDSIINDYKQSERENSIALGEKYKEDLDGKRLYDILIKDLKGRKIAEETFINGLYDIIKDAVDFSDFYKNLETELSF